MSLYFQIVSSVNLQCSGRQEPHEANSMSAKHLSASPPYIHQTPSHPLAYIAGSARNNMYQLQNISTGSSQQSFPAQTSTTSVPHVLSTVVHELPNATSKVSTSIIPLQPQLSNNVAANNTSMSSNTNCLLQPMVTTLQQQQQMQQSPINASVQSHIQIPIVAQPQINAIESHENASEAENSSFMNEPCKTLQVVSSPPSSSMQHTYMQHHDAISSPSSSSIVDPLNRQSIESKTLEGAETILEFSNQNTSFHCLYKGGAEEPALNTTYSQDTEVEDGLGKQDNTGRKERSKASPKVKRVPKLKIKREHDDDQLLQSVSYVLSDDREDDTDEDKQPSDGNKSYRQLRMKLEDEGENAGTFIIFMVCFVHYTTNILFF